jgi:hypothetical protein
LAPDPIHRPPAPTSLIHSQPVSSQDDSAQSIVSPTSASLSGRSRVRLASKGEYPSKGEIACTIHVEDTQELITLFVHRTAQVREIAQACGQETWAVWQRIHNGWKELELDAVIHSLTLPPRPMLRVKPMELECIRIFITLQNSRAFHECLFCPSFLVRQSLSVGGVIDQLRKKGRLTNFPLSQYHAYTISFGEHPYASECYRWSPIIDLARDGQLWMILGRRRPCELFHWLSVEATRGDQTSSWKYPVTNKMKVAELTRIVFLMQKVKNVTFSKESETELEPFRSHVMIESLNLTAADKIVAVTELEVESENIDEVPFIEHEKVDRSDHYHRKQERERGNIDDIPFIEDEVIDLSDYYQKLQESQDDWDDEDDLICPFHDQLMAYFLRMMLFA